LSGYLPNIKISFDELYFKGLQITGGADLQTIGADFKVGAFLLKQFRKNRALKNPFALQGRISLTQEDIEKSPAIRQGIQTIVDTILGRLTKSVPQITNGIRVHVEKVSTAEKGLYFSGIFYTAITKSIPFSFRTNFKVTGNGHILVLEKPQLSVNKGSYTQIKLPTHIAPAGDICICIGDSASLESIEVDVEKVTIEARLLFSAVPILSFAAAQQMTTCTYDVGSVLSNIWGFQRL